MKKDIIIDGANKKIGRLASEAAYALRGKTTADYMPNHTQFPRVVVKNVDYVNVSIAKLKSTHFQRYSGYPSGRKIIRALDISKKDMREVLKHAIWGMLPKNKLRDRMIKNLILYHGNKE